MKKITILLGFLLLLFVTAVHAQTITYSEPERDDNRSMTYEIIGKLNGNVIVVKSFHDQHYVVVYGSDMKLISKTKQDYITETLLDESFVQYGDFFYMFYQYQRRGIIYGMVVKIDANGNKVGNPVQLDTTNVNNSSSNKVYSITVSEDKQKILLFKINSKSDKEHLVTTLLYDKQLNLLHKTRFLVAMPERNDYLTEFIVDNDGDLACIKESGSAQNDNINKLSLLLKPAYSDNIKNIDLKLNNIYLDDVKLKADNANKHYLVTSFYSKQRRGNVEGLYAHVWDKQNDKELLTTNILFTDDLRNEAKSDGTTKTAFNDFFVQNIIMKKDGGFVIVAESVYTSSRGNTNKRWDYMYGSPYTTPYSYYYYGSPLGYYNYPWNRGSSFGNAVRYFADNVAVLSFDANSKMEWSNVIRKSQFDDNSDNYIGYGIMNAGSEIHFLFNTLDKRDWILSDQTVAPDGQLTRKPTFKNLDKGYDFMPRQAKQVGARQVIVPCMYRSYICFAKIDF